MKFQPRPRFEALAIHGRAHFLLKTVLVEVFGCPESPWKGGSWSPLERPGGAWRAHMLG